MVVATGCVLAAPGMNAWAQGTLNVTEHHNHDTRDGLYVEPAFTQAAAAALKRDLSFDGNISGNVYAQPLYIEGGPGGKAMRWMSRARAGRAKYEPSAKAPLRLPGDWSMVVLKEAAVISFALTVATSGTAFLRESTRNKS